MFLSDLSIRRPVFATMIILAMVIFGFIAFRGIGVDLFPRVEFPAITIVSILPGGDPASVETTVTDPIEEAVSTISGIKDLRSTSADGVSQVILNFELEKNVDIAFSEVQAKISTIRSQLPRDLLEPVVEKFDIDSAPIMAVVVSADLPIGDLTQVADKIVKDRLQKVSNVGQVKLVGGQRRNMWLWLERDKLAGHQLTVQDVRQALVTEHVEIPGGRVESGPREYVVKTRAEFTSAAQFDDMVLAYRGGAPVRLGDVGMVEDGLQEQRSIARLNDTQAISLLVRRQSGSNTVQVAHAVHRELEKLRKELEPRGVRLEVAQDLSVYIEHSIDEIKFHLLVGGLFAVLIVWLFLRNFRITMISAIAIPVSVISTFTLMNAMNFTMNNLTMLALSLSIGLLIDDAIVVVENIFRHVEEGKPPREAASFGTAEIGLAAFAITMSIVAVFLPVAFMKGIIGRFFFQFGMTVTFAVLVSLFVAFTVVPMLSSRFLHIGEGAKHGRFYRWSEHVLSRIDSAYARLLGLALRRRGFTAGIAIISLVLAVLAGRTLRSEFVPAEDQSEFNVSVKAPLGATLETTDAILAQARALIAGQPWVRYTFATVGTDALQRVNEGSLYVKMVEKNQRKLSQLDAMRWAREQLTVIRDARISVGIVPRIGGGGGANYDLNIEVRGNDLDALEGYANTLMNELRQAGGYQDIDTSYDKNKPEMSVTVKRNAAADLGVSPLAIASTVRALVGGEDVAKFRSDGDRFDVSIRLRPMDRESAQDVSLLSLRNSRGQLIPLSGVANVSEAIGPVQINHYNRARQITVLANLNRAEKVLGQASAEIPVLAAKLGMPPGYSVGLAGMADTMRESFGYLLFALFLAVVMIYMVLAAQFESFLHPFTIMLSLPLSAVGALFALAAGRFTISIFTMIGFIMLMGLVTKNAILLVDYANTLRSRDGMARLDALMKAGSTRLRPILMTTLAMIFGMLPIALSTGVGSESRAPMAAAVVGGLITSTLLTLVVVPVAYTAFDDMGNVRQWRLVKRFFPVVRPVENKHEAA